MSLVACECLPSPGLEPEPCSRARSQARVYLEQIRNRVALGVPDMTKRDYLVDAATQIRLALERDVSEDYEAAFNHYQNGVDVLLRGIHVDPNKERREAVKLKITKYLRRAEEIFNCHLQRPLSSGASPSARDLAVLPRLVSNSLPQVQLVQDPATGGTFVVKAEPTQVPHGEQGAADHHPTRSPLHDEAAQVLCERGLHLPAPGACASGQRWSPSAAGRPWTISTAPQRWVGFPS
ncbi:RPS6KL1 isoform 15 [Pan troglodytes]|uniref:RPS6KL1 isoform 15 n=1 Tax=Pan troglodytes TaxID=9598 RepID=A0A2J8PJV6_PANTR|nr:RPS6KL1 isoform 15 [Pan troglodytes]